MVVTNISTICVKSLILWISTCSVMSCMYFSYILQSIQMEEYVSLFYTPLVMTQWGMRAVLSGGVQCNLWRKYCCLWLACWQVRECSIMCMSVDNSKYHCFRICLVSLSFLIWVDKVGSQPTLSFLQTLHTWMPPLCWLFFLI